MSNDILALKCELLLIREQLNQQLDGIEKRLDDLTEKGHQNVVTETASPQQLSVQADTNPVNTAPGNNSAAEQSGQSTIQEADCSQPAPWSFLATILRSLLSVLFDWFAPVRNIYRSYQQRGLLGIFILTVIGIGLTLSGFGYLMQLVIDQMGAGAKSLLMAGAAAGVIGIGIGLKLKTIHHEFASAIIALGVLLGYSTVYFSGSVYELIPQLAILILYLGVALLCHFLAYVFDTKIVAAMGIIGIATMPILSDSIHIDTDYYLASLIFVGCSSLILAYRIVGQWLAHLTLAFVVASIEWLIGPESLSISGWFISVFYLMFYAYTLLSLLKQKSSVQKNLIFLAAVFGSTILLFLQTTDISSWQVTTLFLINTLIALGTSVLLHKLYRSLAPFYILLTAAWAAFSIISLFSQAYWGIGWAAEGLLLLYLGQRYQLSATINQGQALTAIAMLFCGFALAPYFPLPALQTIDGWSISIVMLIALSGWRYLLGYSESFDPPTRQYVKPAVQLLEMVWLSILVISASHLLIGNWTGVIILLLQIGLLFRAKRISHSGIELFAAALILVSLSYAYQGALLAESFRFTHLPWFAKFAVISAFLQLWLWSAFYRKFQPNSRYRAFSEHARILFYMLIPVCWLGTAVRRLELDVLAVIWLSPLTALLISKYVKHDFLVKEVKVLIFLASLAVVLGIGIVDPILSVIALTGITGVYLLAWYFNNRYPSNLYHFVVIIGIISMGLALPNLIGSVADSLLFGIISASLYWTVCLNLSQESGYLRTIKTLTQIINVLLLVCAWVLIDSNPLYATVPCLLVAGILYRRAERFETSDIGIRLHGNLTVPLNSIFAITYVLVLLAISGFRADLLIAPVMAVHGAAILFLKARTPQTIKFSFTLIFLGIAKLSLIDAANALLWQKVILFMGIGIFILVASFWYQKAIKTVTRA
ncbi:DUF2339 domain-containing protein [Thalassotalea mangrovi]|uniref:DUF2339 domain-containing protein n=1 Tax=Thalassotalea mangrovi TaxID=2572245 RepID=A0A4U1B8J0_9GAMM|nr:DUF2339 domain-containing protein [Thalassotalea mangrovi]TKB46588.1 DUF2339 domain-containing protein [Thalassotalea mangrovi]